MDGHSGSYGTMDVEQAYRCGKCGICLQTCPVYQQMLDESASPRAKLQLIKQVAGNVLPTSAHLKQIVSRCLMCGNCTASCPSGVEHPLLFMQTRALLAADYGQDWKKKVLFHFLSHEDQMRVAAKLARVGQKTVLENLDRDITLGHLHLKHLPAFNAKPFREQLPERIPAIGRARGTVIYFTGCGTQYLYDAVGHAAVTVLRRMGYRVEIPGGQVCCGLPMIINGNFKGAKNNILKNVDLLARDDIAAVVTDCATCGSALRKEYPLALAELGLSPDRAAAVAEKVQDISEFLFAHMDALTPLFNAHLPRIPVTYHSPCHLRNFQGVETQVEALLQALPNVAYTRSADYNSCCGGGGSFFLDYPEISKKMADEKIRNARATGARIWATGCPGCRIALAANLSPEDHIDLRHPVELVGAAIEPQPPEK